MTKEMVVGFILLGIASGFFGGWFNSWLRGR